MKKLQLYVIIPDRSSGDWFINKLHKQGIATEYGYFPIHPRVIGDKLTTSPLVARDMNRIFHRFTDETKSVVIACNTLQLWIDDIHQSYKKHVKIYTTFEACDWKFRSLHTPPVWLGTTPLVERVTQFPTLLSLGHPDVQRLVQELIWRIKMVYHDDIKTAFESVRNDRTLPPKKQWQKIHEIKDMLVYTIRSLGISTVILGCTELPMVFRDEGDTGVTWVDPADVLAEYIKHQSVMMLFAGGTISSLVRSDGTRIDGKVFNLLERLSLHMPGSFRHLNITKSDVLYSGMSEQMNPSLLSSIWRHVRDAIKCGPSRIVLTHGTDAMEQTARYIHDRFQKECVNAPTTIILTGANVPPNDKTTDAWHNLRYAISVPVNRTGVYIAFADRFVAADECVKIYEKTGNRYVSKKSGEYSRWLIRQQKQNRRIQRVLRARLGVQPDTSRVVGYEVNRIRKDHASFLRMVEKQKPSVVIFQLYHSGTANTTDKKGSILPVVAQLVSAGVVCFGVTETGEPTMLLEYESGKAMRKAGLIPLCSMTYDSALYKAALAVSYSQGDKAVLIDTMLTSYAGEIDESVYTPADRAFFRASVKQTNRVLTGQYPRS